MAKIFSKVILTLFFWGIFIYVVFTVSYPDSLTQANIQQILFFFVPLFLAFIFTINIFTKNFPISGSISLGLIFLLILKALDSLNIVTGILILAAVGFLVSYFVKIKKRNLTKLPKIPKLTRLQKKLNKETKL